MQRKKNINSSKLYYALSCEEALKETVSSREGLSIDEARSRLETQGYNDLPDKDQASWFSMAVRQLNNIFVYVLIAASALSFYLGNTLDASVILGIIIINALLGFSQEFKAEKAIRALKKLSVQYAKVFRSGSLVRIPSRNVVKGDIVFLEEGDLIPADIRIFEAHNFRTQEASLSGESLPIEKYTERIQEGSALGDQKNMGWMSTFVASGSARGVVVATGSTTAIGAIARQLETIERTPSHFFKKTTTLTLQMGLFALVGSAFIFIIGFFIQHIPFSQIFLFAVASLVSGIPEGLPAVLTIVLALGAHRMAKRRALVRVLSATETLGVVSAIMTDKTGTLTENTMTVQSISGIGGDDVEVSGTGWSTSGDFMQSKEKIFPLDSPRLFKALHIAALCNSAHLVHDEKIDIVSVLGDPTEGALVVLAEKAGIKKSSLEEADIKIDDLPFNSDFKFRASLIKEREGEKTELYVVGAPERVLQLCKTYLDEQGGLKKCDDTAKEYMHKKFLSFAKKGHRVLALAYAPLAQGKQEARLSFEGIDDLIFVSLVSMQDPPRADVPEAIATAKRAGIRVIMATGDHSETAFAIAKQIGLLSQNAQLSRSVLQEEELQLLDEAEFSKAVSEFLVFARLSPSMKLKIAEELQRQGHIVAMTGDGVNDAPALKRADVGVSMGNIGTDVAREASQLVLLDDHFASIVHAVQEGRIVFRNIRQASYYLMTTNFAEYITAATTLILGLPLPLLPTQILWLNIVSDGVNGIALVTEEEHGSTMKNPPRSAKENIVTQSILPFLIVISVVMVIATVMLFSKYLIFGLDSARTMAFLVMSFTQIFNIFNMRSLKKSIFLLGFTSNKWVLASFFLSALLTVGVLFIPFFQNIFHLTRLPLFDIALAIFASSFVLWFGEVYKFLFKRS